MRKLASLVAGVAVLTFGASPAAATDPQPEPGAIVLVGVPALRWADVTERGTPTLWRLAGSAAVGSLSVRATADLPHAETAPADGWATVGAGNRATGRLRRTGDPLALPSLPADLAALVDRNEALPFESTIGALGDSLRDAGVRRVAFGQGAVLALADGAGAVDEVHPAPAIPADLAVLASAVKARAVVAIEAAQLLPRTSAAALTQVDQLVAEVEKTLTAQDILLIAGLSDRPGDFSHLRVAMAVGGRYEPGRLRSALTRRAGFVQLIDLGPTILELRGVRRNEETVGRPWTRASSAAESLDEAVAELVDADRAADGYRRYVPPFFLLLVLVQVLLYGGAYLALRRSNSERRAGVLSVTRNAALAFAAVPAATYLAHLAPWWRYPIGYLIAVVATVVGLMVLAATRGPWRRRPFGPEGFVAGTTFVVIAIDLLTGARLQLSSLAGYSPVVAGRFAGVGNVAFAVFATSALLFAVALCVGATPRRAVAGVAGVGAIAIVIDGSPLWGSDFGGVLALVPAFAVLAILVSSRRLSRGIILATAVGAVAVVGAFALADYARPADSQTHLGRFVGQLLHGGAGPVVRRKAQANLRLLTRSVLTLVVPLAVAFVSVVLLRPVGGLRRALDAIPVLRSGFISVLVMSLAGFVFNDSGVAVPALALSVAVPLALATSMQYVDPPGLPAPARDQSARRVED
ncbi:MAG: hypothetical protein ABIM89_05395 [Mycobacteriales bacterium]